VNISAAHFMHPNFLECVISAMQRYHVKPALLKVELTESVVAVQTAVIDGVDLELLILRDLTQCHQQLVIVPGFRDATSGRWSGLRNSKTMS